MNSIGEAGVASPQRGHPFIAARTIAFTRNIVFLHYTESNMKSFAMRGGPHSACRASGRPGVASPQHGHPLIAARTIVLTMNMTSFHY